LRNDLFKRYLSTLLALVMVFSAVPLPAQAVESAVEESQAVEALAENNTAVINGVSIHVDGNGTLDDSVTGKVTVTATSGTNLKTTVITVENTAATAKVSFKYTTSEQVNAWTLNGNALPAEGTFFETMEKGEIWQFSLTANRRSTASVTFSEFVIATVSENSTVTVLYDKTLGSITAGGASDTDEDGKIIVENVDSSGLELTATAGQDATFVGWTDGSGKTLSTETTYTHYPASENETVEAVFASTAGLAWFKVGDFQTTDLNKAIEEAESSGNKTVVLAVSGTLSAGTYTIPAGVKLLIPYSAEDSGNFGTSLATTSEIAPGKQSAFRTLTLADGAVIDCYGMINVNSRVYAKAGGLTGRPTGDYGAIKLNGSNAKINIGTDTDGNKGTLYCYGYITGSGAVTADSGGTVYEIFQMLGWPGGTMASAWHSESDSIESFLFNDYAVQNIEADLVVKQGATAAVVASVTVSDMTKPTSTTYIGTEEGLVSLVKDGVVTRHFTPETNRMQYTMEGTVSVAGIDISVTGLPFIGSISMNSADHILAINHYMDFVAAEGSKVTLENKYMVAPGATLTVDGGAEAYLKGSAYIYDTADYMSVYGGSKTVSYIASLGGTAGVPSMNSGTPSGKITVNGTLTVNGSMFATENGGASADKVLYGSGTLINKSTATASSAVLDYVTYEEKEGWFGSTTVASPNPMPCVPAVGQLTGFSSENGYHSFSKGTYIGLGDGHWYQKTVTFSGDLSELKAYNGSVISINGNTATGYSCTDGTLQFALPFTYSASCSGAEMTCAAAPGSAVMAYSVPVTADVTIAVTAGSATNNATIKYVSKGDGKVVFSQECYIPVGTDVSAYFSDGACTTNATTFSSDDTLYILVEAKVGNDKYYATLGDAIENAQNPGDVVTLISDITVASPITVSAQQDIDIALAGHTVTYSSNLLKINGTVDLDLQGGKIINAQGAEVSALIVAPDGVLNLDVNGGELTWSDYGVEGYSFSATSPTALVHCYSGGTANIDIAEGETISVVHPNAVTTYALHVLINEGTMTVNGAGTVTSSAYTATTGAYVNSGSDTYNAAPPVVNRGSMMIQGITVSSTNTNGSKNYAILNYDGGNLTLDGANVSCASGYSVYNWGGTIDSIKDSTIIGTNGICNYNMAGYGYTATVTEIVGATTIQGTGGHAISTHPETYVGVIGGEGSDVELIASANGINGNEGYIKELGNGLTIIASGYGVYTRGVVETVSLGGYYKTGNSVFYADTGTEETPYNASIGLPEGYHLSVMAQMRTLRNGKTYGCSYLTDEEQNYPQILAGHLQELPEINCSGPDLWQALTPEHGYFTQTQWDSTSQPTVYSITIPVQPGDRISASSFGTTQKADDTSSNGIRVTWFDENGILTSWNAATTYSNNKTNGYVTAPEGAIAVCIPVWVGDWEGNEAYLVKDCVYEYLDEDSDGFYTAVCSGCGTPHEGLGEHLQIPAGDYCVNTNLWTTLKPEKNRRLEANWTSDAYYSITFPVEAGDRIWANSFQKTPDNDHTSNGIRVTWFANNGSTPSFNATEVYNEFSKNMDEATGKNYITAPESAIAVCVSMWVKNANSAVYVLNRPHNYESVVTEPTCSAGGYTIHTCTSCDHSYKDSETEATSEHKFTNYVSNGDATAEADGTKTAVCDYGCGTESTIADEGSSAVYKALEGKVISIMGDSISTMEGYIPTADGFNLEHYARYVLEAEEGSSFIEFDPNETWWMQVINTFGAKLGINESWRSTEIGNIFDVEVNSGYEGTKACMASMTRIQNLGSNGTPDLILFYGGTNDITQRNNANPRVLGSFMESMVPAKVDLTTDKWDTVIEAYVTALMRMHHFYPETRIVCMFPTVTGSNPASVVSTYNAEFKKVCDHFIAQGYDIVYTDLLDSGITTAHHVDGTHPNEEGMDLITAAVNKKLLQTCGDFVVGENVVYSVTHDLDSAKASRSYYKGVSHGKAFVETLTGEELTVTVTMGGEDVTASVYDAETSVISIAEVSGDLAITAQSNNPLGYLEPYLQELPENVYNTTNLWPLLEHNEKYYRTTVNDTKTAYSEAIWNVNGDVRSVTVPVESGDRIYASSLTVTKGIRITWFFADKTFVSWQPSDARARFVANTDEKSGKHYIEAPEAAVAVNVSMWDGSDSNEFYILTLPDDPLTLNELPDHLRQLPEPCYNDTNIWAELKEEGKLDDMYYTSSGWGTTGVKSITIPVEPGNRIDAYSFGVKGSNGGSQSGIRVTWFLSDGGVVKMGPADTYEEYSKNDNNYLTAPANAVAVCVPMWSDNEKCYVYNLDLPDNPLKAHDLLDHLVDLPEPCYNDTNIWAELAAAGKLDGKYWNGSVWGTTGQAKSVTVRVNPGDRLTATSFGTSEGNNGIRVTWFFADGSTPKSMAKGEVYTEYTTNGWLTAPENAVAVCVPMWEAKDTCEFYNLDLPDRPLSDIENYNGKVISIMGDSISTFTGYTPVADGFNLAHRNRYPQNNLSTDVNETWWMQVLTELDAKLGINDSWAGSRVLNVSDTNSGDLGPDAAMASLTRIQNLGANGTPDVILFYGGTNDIGGSVTLGTFDPDTAPTEADLTATKWNSLADAYVAAILRMRHYYPKAEIVAMLPTYTSSYYTNDELAEYNAILAAICEHYGVVYTDLRDCGLTVSDLGDGIHPNAKGFDYITDAVLDVLLNEVEMTSGENVVYEISHELTNAEASKHYYKGVSHGAKFEETISSQKAANVTVKMGEDDITAAAYNAETGVISIDSVTGVITVTASAERTNSDHVQPLPDPVYRDTNLWAALEPEKEYYAADGWNDAYYSITFPVNPGDKIWSISLCDSSINGNSQDGICITWFKGDEVLKRLPRTEADAEFKEFGCVTAPEGATAVNVPTWTTAIKNEVYNLSLPTVYDDYLLELDRDTICAGINVWELLEDQWSKYYYKEGSGWITSSNLRSITIPVQVGDKIKANVFGVTSGGTGIRITWFDETGVLESKIPGDVNKEFVSNGYLTAPEGAVAVNLPVWNYQNENSMYILNLGHYYVENEDGDIECKYCHKGHISGGGSVEEGEEPGDEVAQIVGQRAYATLEEAIAAAGADDCILMLTDSGETIAIDKAVLIDLNGLSLSNVIVSATGVRFMDSTANAYGGPAGKVTVADGEENIAEVSAYAYGDGLTSKYYVKVVSGNSCTFHRVAVHVTGIQLALTMEATPTGYLSFRGTFRGDDLAAEKLTNVGFMFNNDEKTAEWFGKDGTSALEPKDQTHFYYTHKLDTINDVVQAAALMELGEGNTREGTSVDVNGLLHDLKDALSEENIGLNDDQKKAFDTYFKALTPKKEG